MKTLLLLLFSLGFALSVACSGTDSDDIPRKITAYNVYLFDKEKAPDADYFAGTISTSYSKRKEDLDRARALAYSEAKRLHFDTDNSRYYIICTATDDDSCVTKIR